MGNMGSEEHKKAHEEAANAAKAAHEQTHAAAADAAKASADASAAFNAAFEESICLDLRTISRMLATLLLLLWIPWALMSRLILRLRREGNLVKFPLLRLLPLPQQL